MTEQEILDLNQNEIYDGLQKEFGQNALGEVGSFTQEFKMEVSRRGLKQEYVLHIKSLLGLPESLMIGMRAMPGIFCVQIWLPAPEQPY